MGSTEDNTDDEFDIEEYSIKDPATVFQRLKEFTYYLMENIEFNLNFCLKLLEERPTSSKPNSIHITALSLLCSKIPTIGGGLSSALKTGEVMMFKKIDKKNSRILADLVYYFSDNKETMRNTVIEAAAEVFSSFETQFMQLTCNGGDKRAMQKLAVDASDRIFNYFLMIEQYEKKKDFTKNEIIKGVIFGDSKRNRGGKKEGKSVFTSDKKDKSETKNVKWKTCKLYSKVGITIPNRNLFFKNEQTKPEKYGYRKIFSWENEEDIRKEWTLDDHFEHSKFSLEIDADLLQIIKEYVMTKNPYDEAKLERQKYNQEAMDDRREKHEEALKILKEYFDIILNDNKDSILKLTNIQLENTTLLKSVSENQEEENKIQIEIMSKLETVYDNVIETKEKQDDLIKTNEDIKGHIKEIISHQEEIAGAMVKQEEIEQIVTQKVQEGAKEGVKEYVNEILRKNDPGPKIGKELKRVERRLRKLF